MAAGTAAPIVTLGEAQAFARIETGEEEALLAGLIRSASGLCESFLGQIVIERSFTEQLAPSPEWQRLKATPVRSIDSVSANGVVLPSTSYAADIDSTGSGWLRTLDPLALRWIEVRGTAGIAVDENGVPEPIRQGVLRLVAHLFAARDGEGGEIPSAVTALWRPFRRMLLA